MRISNQARCSLNEIAFKAEKQEESDSNLIDALEALLVRRMKKKYK